MKKEFEKTSESLNELIGKVEGNQNQLEQKLDSFEKHVSYADKLKNLDSVFLEISGKIKYTQSLLQKGLDTFEVKDEKPMVNIPNPSGKINIGSVDKKDDVYSLLNNVKEVKISNDNMSNDKLSLFRRFNSEYELMISLKQKSSELVIFDTKTKVFKQVKINNSNFIDTSNAFTTFPDNSRYVNLGTSILITGGYKDRQSTSFCYLMLFSKKNTQSNEYEINIMSYPNMIEARERHNVIHLKDKDSVLVCSGFFNQNAEITNMNNNTWKSLPKLNDIRANAALSYINQRYIYCFSGFKINDVKVGQYLNSVDILDLNDTSKGWTLVNFDNMNINLKLCAMGIINLTETSMLLCGGYDGSQYKNDVYKVDTKENGIAKVERIESTLPGNYIFIHNAFMRSENLSYNYDLQLNLISYNPMSTENQFKVI